MLIYDLRMTHFWGVEPNIKYTIKIGPVHVICFWEKLDKAQICVFFMDHMDHIIYSFREIWLQLMKDDADLDRF